MSVVTGLIKLFFGTKSEKDRKAIQPYVDKIKAIYPSIEQLTVDELRARSAGLKAAIAEYISAEEQQIAELKVQLENLDTSLDDKERISKQIDTLTEEIDRKIEEKLDEIMPEAFSIMKETARRFKENEEIVVTATDFDRELAAAGKDFIRIDGDKAVYSNSWVAGGNKIVWDMVHYDCQLFGGVVLHKGNIAEMATGGDAARVLERAGREGRARGDRQRLPGAPRLRMDGAAVSVPRIVGGLHRPTSAQFESAPQGLYVRYYVRDEQRVRFRLPARQHGDLQKCNGSA